MLRAEVRVGNSVSSLDVVAGSIAEGNLYAISIFIYYTSVALVLESLLYSSTLLEVVDGIIGKAKYNRTLLLLFFTILLRKGNSNFDMRAIVVLLYKNG